MLSPVSSADTNARFARDLALARRGDAEALERLLEQNRERIERLAEERLGKKLKAKVRLSDVIQAAWLQAIRFLPGFKGDTEETFSAWLGKVLDNVIRKQDRFFQAEKRHTPSRAAALSDLAKALAPGRTSPSREAAELEELQLVRRALARLPPEYREVVQLCVIEELPHRDAAERLGRSEGATRMLLCRARAALGLEIEKARGDRS